MSQHEAAQSPPTESRRGLSAGQLRVWDIVFFVVSAAAPLTVVVSAAPAALRLGGIGAPGAILICAVVLMLFAFGFTAMSTHIRNAGAFYAYVGQGIGKPAGIGIAFVTLISYAVLAVSFYGFIGFFGELTASNVFGLSLPWWVWSLLAVVLVGALGLRRIDVGAKVLAVLLTAEVIILLILAVAVLSNGGPEPLSAEPFSPTNIFAGAGVSALFVIGFGAFLGFEGTAIYAEEAHQPTRTIPLATYISIAFLGIFYAFTFWVVIVAFGVEGVIQMAQSTDFEAMVIVAGGDYLGAWATVVIQILIVTSFFASVLAFHNASSRYMFALGRERILPSVLATTGKNSGAPGIASVTLSTIGGVAVVIAALLQLDPYLEFALLAYAAGVAGLVFSQAIAAVSVVGFFARDRRGHSALRVIIAPALGALGLITGLILIVANFQVVSGNEGFTNWALLLPTPVLFIAGIVAGLVLRRKSPDTYSALTQSIPIVEQENNS